MKESTQILIFVLIICGIFGSVYIYVSFLQPPTQEILFKFDYYAWYSEESGWTFRITYVGDVVLENVVIHWTKGDLMETMIKDSLAEGDSFKVLSDSSFIRVEVDWDTGRDIFYLNGRSRYFG